MPNLKLTNITKSYDGKQLAVDNLNLSVEHGEFVCLLGPSGCGKTTTLRMIAGFEKADSGTIELDNADITRLPPQRRDIGLVFQSYALFPHKTAAENVGFGLKMRGVSRAERDEKIRDALAMVRLEHIADRYPKQLSGGQQQRVALARALAIRPRLLLMDEPLSNLDAKLRDAMRDEIRRIQREVGITAIFVTHDQSEALALADKVAVMSAGRLMQIADPTTIYEFPENATVDQFIGHVNVVSGVVIRADGSGAEVALPSGEKITSADTRVSTDTKVLAMVKFERVVLARNRDEGHGENVLPCTVESRTYLGGTIMYRCSVGGSTMTSAMPNHPSFPRFAEGDLAFLRWSSGDCRLFPQ